MLGSFLAYMLGLLFLVAILPGILAISAFALWRCLIPPPPAARFHTRGSLPIALCCWFLLVAIGSVYAYFKLNPSDFIVVTSYRAAAAASAPFPKVESWANGGMTESHQMLRLSGPSASGLIEIDFKTNKCIVADGQGVHIASGLYDATKLEQWFEAAGFDSGLPASQAQIAEIADFIDRVRPFPEGHQRFTGPWIVDSQPSAIVDQPATLRELPGLHAGHAGLIGCVTIGILGAVFIVRRRRKLLRDAELVAPPIAPSPA